MNNVGSDTKTLERIQHDLCADVFIFCHFDH